MNTQYGIWSGRFNIIHNGQESVLKKIINQYDTICIDIMNPTPGEPDWETIDNNEKYSKENNPLSYFQRLYLWSALLRYYSIEAVIVPHWPPLKSLDFENTFLPPKSSREWIIPKLKDSEYKASFFIKLREKIRYYDVDPYSSSLNTSELINNFRNDDNALRTKIPKTVLYQTEKFLRNELFNDNFIVVPILSDEIDSRLICQGIQHYCDTGDNIIFSPVVEVENNNNWWKNESKKNGFFSFFQKYEILSEIMHNIEIYDYYVIPILKKGNKCYKIEDFFPDLEKIKWLFKRGINTDRIFNDYYSLDVINYTSKDIDDNRFLDIAVRLYSAFCERRYYLYQKEESEENKMAKYDFRGANFGGDFIETLQGNKTTINSKPINQLSADELLDEVFKTDDPNSLKDLLLYIDEKTKDMNEKEQKKTVEDSVKKHIDTESKKKGFLKKIEEAPFDITKSVIGGLILHAIKALIFGV